MGNLWDLIKHCCRAEIAAERQPVDPLHVVRASTSSMASLLANDLVDICRSASSMQYLVEVPCFLDVAQ